MTVLVKIRQKIKQTLGNWSVFLIPVAKLVVAFLYFRWINANMGYMEQLNAPFIPVIFAILGAILPPVVTVMLGLLMILVHAYGLGFEALGFMAVLILLLVIFFLRFSSGTSYVMALTPLSFAFGVPVMLPVGCGLLCSSSSMIPAGCGAILYYFIKLLRTKVELLQNPNVDPVTKLRDLADSFVQDWGMWITVCAFVLVILVVHFIRTRSFNYAWRIAIAVGGGLYILVMLVGTYYLSASVDIPHMIITTLLAILAGLAIEYFFFCGDYSRTEYLEYEDDEYYYYVKAVPKATAVFQDRSVKKIGGGPDRRMRPDYSYRPEYYGDIDQRRDRELERKLEESLRDL